MSSNPQRSCWQRDECVIEAPQGTQACLDIIGYYQEGDEHANQ